MSREGGIEFRPFSLEIVSVGDIYVSFEPGSMRLGVIKSVDKGGFRYSHPDGTERVDYIPEYGASSNYGMLMKEDKDGGITIYADNASVEFYHRSVVRGSLGNIQKIAGARSES